MHCVRGNHDAHVLGLTKADCERARNEGRWKWSHDNFEKIGEEGLAFLQSLPLTLRFSVDGVAYQMQHQYDQGYGTVESLDQFNRFWQGDELEALVPRQGCVKVAVSALWDENGTLTDCANRAVMDCSIPFEKPLPVGTMLRRKVDEA